jgi:hypothetical protein
MQNVIIVVVYQFIADLLKFMQDLSSSIGNHPSLPIQQS